jgi:hypothetical protein
MTRPTPRTIPGLFENWLTIEKRRGTVADAVARLNEACDTAYRANWPHLLARNGYALERIPLPVRCYLMRIVLTDELARIGVPQRAATVSRMVRRLT